MLTQKLYKNGNSVAVTIPKQHLEDLKLKEGSKVFIYHDEVENTLTIAPTRKRTLSPGITPEFKDWLESFNKEYGPALKALAEK